MNPARILLLTCALCVAIVMPARDGAAQGSHWPSAFERPAGVIVNNQLVLHEVVGYGEATSSVASKRTQTDWQVVSDAPTTSFYIYTGVAGASLTDMASRTAWGGQAAIYAIGGDNQLYQCNYAMGSATCTWRPVTGALPTGMSLGNNGGLAVAWDAFDRRMFVGFVQAYNGTNYSGHLWECILRTSSTSVCEWVDASCNTSDCSHVSQSSSGKISVAIDPAAPQRNDPGWPDVETYIISPDGHLQRWRHFDAQWDSAIPFPPNPSGTTVDFVGIQAWSVVDASWNGTSYAAVAGWNHIDAGDTLQFAKNATGTSWSWSYLSGGPNNTLSYSPGNIAEALDGAATRIWVSDLFGKFWRCGLVSDSCTWDSYVGPADQAYAPLGNDRLGGGSFAYGSVGYISGTLGATAEYLFALDGATGRWANHLTLRDGSVLIPGSPTMNLGEYSAAEFDGTVFFAGSDIGGPGPNATTVWRSTNDGSSWASVGTPFGADRADENIAIDGDANIFLTAVVGATPPFSVQIARWTGATWSPPFSIPTTVAETMDRPWVTADGSRSNALYLAFSGGSSVPGRLAYCNGSADCASAASAWCPSSAGSGGYSVIPSRTGCDGYHGSGCWVERDGTGRVWVSVQDDSDCTSPPAGYPPLIMSTSELPPRTSAIGLRYITNAPLGLPCTPPTLSAVQACVYYVARAGPDQLRGGTSGPAMYRRWSSSLSAARDSGRIALTIQAYRELNGNPCNAGSSCRSDVFAVQQAGARLHAHLFNELSPTPGSRSVPVASIASPVAVTIVSR